LYDINLSIEKVNSSPSLVTRARAKRRSSADRGLLKTDAGSITLNDLEHRTDRTAASSSELLAAAVAQRL
jgi:hypothetical protein